MHLVYLSGKAGCFCYYNILFIPKAKRTASVPSSDPSGVEVALNPEELELDTAAMAAKYEERVREQQAQVQKEDFSDMVADHAAKQKVKLQFCNLIFLVLNEYSISNFLCSVRKTTPLAFGISISPSLVIIILCILSILGLGAFRFRNIHGNMNFALQFMFFIYTIFCATEKEEGTNARDRENNQEI